jgi:signal transduction histidine kinase
VSRVVATATAGVSDLVTARDATITVGDLPSVEGDELFLVQLFQNLLENAIKYCPERKPEITVSCAATEGGTEFAVADNGMGIAAADVSAIFRPFRRLDGVVDIEGSGIGLATCWRIVQLHGGELWCESEPGRGSVFRFTLAGAVTGTGAAD